MLEQETERILAALRGRTIGERESLLLKEVLASDIPRGIKSYIQAETHQSLSKELFSTPRFAHVDHATPGIRRLSQAFISSMAAGYRYGREEYLGLLENAVHFLGNYLCRPQWTMENFVFQAGNRVTLEELLPKLEYTADYAYFKTLIGKIAHHRNWGEVGVEEFRSILAAIDDQIVKQHDARELALLAKPIFDFLLLRDTPPDVSIPLKPILVFFDDKKMKILRDYIESICRIRERSDITLDELTALVEDLYLGHTEEIPSLPPPMEEAPAEAEPSEPPEAPRDAPPAIPIEEPSSGVVVPSIFDYVTEEPDGWDDQPPLEETQEPPSSQEEPTPRQGPTDSAGPPISKQNLSLSLTFAGLDEQGTSSIGLPDLRDAIPGSLRAQFVRKLFNKDEQEYEDVITALNDAGTWKDASLLLNKIYRIKGLDPFDADVVEFTDAVQRRYLDAEKDLE